MYYHYGLSYNVQSYFIVHDPTAAISPHGPKSRAEDPPTYYFIYQTANHYTVYTISEHEYMTSSSCRYQTINYINCCGITILAKQLFSATVVYTSWTTAAIRRAPPWRRSASSSNSIAVRQPQPFGAFGSSVPACFRLPNIMTSLFDGQMS